MLCQSVQDIVKDPALSPMAKLRIVILFALRYQKSKANDIANLINLLLENGVSREDARVSLQSYSCLNQRLNSLNSSYTILFIDGIRFPERCGGGSTSG